MSKTPPIKQVQRRATKSGAVSVQATSGDGKEKYVGIGNLRVLLVPDGKFWFAQGLEIDYGTQGDDKEEARKNFQQGLLASIDLHLRMNGTIDGMLCFASSDVLKEASQKRDSIEFYQHVSAHEIGERGSALPFTGIDYLVSKNEAVH